MTTSRSPQQALLLLFLFAILLSCHAASLVSRRSSGLRGERGVQRSLKKEEDEPGALQVAPAPAPSPQVIVNYSPNSEQDEEEEEEEYPEDIQVVGGNSNSNAVNTNSNIINNNDNEKDKKDDKEDCSNSYCDPLVKLPELFVVLGVQVTTSSRDSSSYSIPRDNYNALETLLEDYFEALLTQEVMGSNFVTSELDAKLFTTQYFDDNTGAGTLLFFEVKGKAEYEGDSIPKKEAVRDRLVAFFIDWGYDDDLGLYLAHKGIEGAKVANLFVEGNQMPAFYNSGIQIQQQQPQQQQEMQPEYPQPELQPEDSWQQTFQEPTSPSDLDYSVTTTSTSASAVEDEQAAKKGKPVGLIVGLVILFVCLFIASLMLFFEWRNRDKKAATSKGWHDFGSEDGSETSPEQDDSQSISQLFKPKNWFQRPEKKPHKLQRTPSEILRHIKVVVENDHDLKKGGTHGTTNPEDSSGAIHSAETLQHSNYVMSPQNTQKTYLSDEEEESLQSPVVRYSPPSRSNSKMYNREKHHVSPKAAVVSPITTDGTRAPTSPDRNGCRTPAPLEDEDCAGLVEWASNLNPCLLPHSLFRQESERLDNIVANLPRNKSILDVNDSHDSDARTPSPTRRPSSRRSSHRRRSSRKRSGHRHHHHEHEKESGYEF